MFINGSLLLVDAMLCAKDTILCNKLTFLKTSVQVTLCQNILLFHFHRFYFAMDIHTISRTTLPLSGSEENCGK